MRNKQLFQEKITRLESMMNNIQRAVNVNDREAAIRNLELSKQTLSDMQTMINREQEYYN
jgi:uncharacterized protein YutE (UPF0331/DUF86 family)